MLDNRTILAWWEHQLEKKAGPPAMAREDPCSDWFMVKRASFQSVAQCIKDNYLIHNAAIATITKGNDNMKNLLAFLLAAASMVAAAVAGAQTPTEPPYASLDTDIRASTGNSAYLQDARGIVVRNPYGLCWRTGYWTENDAVPGCDIPVCVAPEVLENGRCVAPPPPPAPVEPEPAAAAPVEQPAAAPEPTSEKVSFSADAFFDFDKSVLKPEGRQSLDQLYDQLQDVDVEVVIAVGHTDWIGTDAYNDKLSLRRAEAVRTYLRDKGVPDDRIYMEGKGEKQPIADNKTDEGRARNRRVEIEVVGTRR